MIQSAMTSLFPLLVLVLAAFAALYRRIRRVDSLPSRGPLLPIYSSKAHRPPSRQQKESLLESPAPGEDCVVVVGNSSARIETGGAGAFADRGTVHELESSPEGSAAPTVASSPFRICSSKVSISLSIADADIHVQQVTEDVLLPHPQLPRIRVS